MRTKRFLLIGWMTMLILSTVFPPGVAFGWAMSGLSGGGASGGNQSEVSQTLPSLATLEYYIAAHGGGNLNLSERDMLRQLGRVYDESYDLGPGDIGDDLMAVGYYASWRGPMLETGDPVSDLGLSEYAVLRTEIDPACYVQEVLFLPQKDGSTVAFSRVDTMKPYDRIYQHDILGYNYALKVQSRSSTVSFANVFRAAGPYGETLRAVSFYALSEDTTYEVLVAASFTGPSSLSGGVSVARGKLNTPGYYTIDLEKPVRLEPGSRFAVVVRQTAASRPAVATDSTRGNAVKRSISRPGESYVRLDGNWTDLYNLQPDTNVCLKAFTIDDPAPDSEMMDVLEMEEELEYVLGRMLSYHPVARTKGFSAEQAETIDDVRRNLAVPLAKRNYHIQMQRVFAMMGEGQTTLFNQFGETLYLDLPFVWLMDDGMVVSLDTGILRKGDQILSIGGASPAQLVRMLGQIVPSENEFWLRYTAPSILQRSSYLTHLGLMNPDGTVDVAILRGNVRTVYRIPVTRTLTRTYASRTTEWHIEKDNDLGYLRFDYFPHSDDMEPLAREIAKFFAAVREQGVSNIILDWRYNDGGWAHILPDLLGYIEGGPVYSEGYQLYNTVKRPKAEMFGGQTYVLTSHRTFGAAVLASMLLHDNGMAVTVGEPTGEKPNFSFSTVSNERLPITGWAFRLATRQPGRPRGLDSTVDTLLPDIPVYTSRLDLLAGRDAQLEKLREAIKGGAASRNVPEHVGEDATGSEPESAVEDGLRSRITRFSYSSRFSYFIIGFTDKIAALRVPGISVTDAAGKSLDLREVCVAVDYDNVLIVALRRPIAESDRCVVTLAPNAVVLSGGITNKALLRLSDYRHY